MENQNQVPQQKQSTMSQVPISNPQFLSSEPKIREKAWKIIGIIFASIIVIFSLLAWCGFYLGKQDRTQNDNKINTLNKNTSYKEFALSNNDSSFNPENPENVKNCENGLGLSPRVLEKGDGFVKVSASSAQTVLNIPFGWYGLDTGKNTLFYTLDGKISLSLGFIDVGGIDFAELKKRVRVEYQGYQNQGAQIENTDLPDGSFLSKATGMIIGGEKLSMVSVYTPNPKGGQYYMKLLMSAPPDDFEKYYGLIRLILKDREIIWAN